MGMPSSMMRWLAVLLVSILCTPNSSASEEMDGRALKAFDALCVNTRLQKKIFQSQVQLFEYKEIDENTLHNLSPYNEIGYWVKVDGLQVAALFGTINVDPSTKSKNCTVVIDGLSFNNALEMLQTNFDVKELDRFKQGVSEMAMYRAYLSGYTGKIGFSVQSGLGMSNISILQLDGMQ